MFVLAACGAPERAEPTAAPTVMATVAPTTAPTTVPTPEPPTPEPATAAPATPETATEPTAAPVAESPELSFTPATYTDESAGFALDYPAEWTVDPSSQIGVRGGQALLLSPGTTVEALAEGGTRISIVTYLWDPKNDLDAYVAQRKVAWDASGFPITREDAWQLADGRNVYAFEIKSPEVPTFTILTTIGEDYLQISGEGDLALAEEIARTLRPLN
jgi:hypothetical protein